jgi:hypothetical protein
MKTVKDQFNEIIEHQDFKKQGWLEANRPYIQVAFYIVALFAINDLMITIWRSMTGH